MKDNQRRAQIFSVLDDFKSRDEKITAQKLAAQVKMGKQTVLPYYREWQELEILGEDEEVELSLELTRVLRREIAKEKFRHGEKARDLQDELDERNSEFETSRSEWNQRNSDLAIKIEVLEQGASSLQQEQEELKQKLQDAQSQLKGRDDQVSQLEAQIDKQENRLEREIQQGKQALIEQEQRLDDAHLKIIDHWMKVIDEERREKGRLLKHQDKLQDANALREKEKQECHSALESERRAVSSLHAQNKDQNSLISELEIGQQLLKQIAAEFGNPTDILSSVNKLNNIEARCVHAEKNHAEATSRVKQVEQELKNKVLLEADNRKLTEKVIRLEARMEGIQMAGGLKAPQAS